MPPVFIIRIIYSMDDIYERIIELDGDCFKDKDAVPKCHKCIFMDKCLTLTLNTGKSIGTATRVQWALDKLAEEILLDV
jgi:hypothetical protein